MSVGKRPDSRAKRLKAEPQVTAKRVEQIADMMLSGVWVRGTSEDVLAAEWGLSASRVRDLSAEAWRRVCAQADSPKEARPNIVGTLLIAMEGALRNNKFGDVARLADVWTRIIGAREPEARQEVPMTEEQARAKYRELAGKEWGA